MASTIMAKEEAIGAVPVNSVIRAFELMCCAKAMTEIYEKNAAVTSKYVHATSRGHEAVQIALGMQLKDHVHLIGDCLERSLVRSIPGQRHVLVQLKIAKALGRFSGENT